MAWLAQLLGHHELLGSAQRRGLGSAPALGQRLGEIGEQHREPQPQGRDADEPRRCFALTTERLHPQPGGEQAADEDDEHHRVPELNPWIQLAEGADQGRRDQGRIEHGKSFCRHIGHLRVCEGTVASEGRSRSAGAQEPECMLKYMRIPSTAGTRHPERSRFFRKLSVSGPQDQMLDRRPKGQGRDIGQRAQQQYRADQESHE